MSTELAAAQQQRDAVTDELRRVQLGLASTQQQVMILTITLINQVHEHNDDGDKVADELGRVQVGLASTQEEVMIVILTINENMMMLQPRASCGWCWL